MEGLQGGGAAASVGRTLEEVDGLAAQPEVAVAVAVGVAGGGGVVLGVGPGGVGVGEEEGAAVEVRAVEEGGVVVRL